MSEKTVSNRPGGNRPRFFGGGRPALMGGEKPKNFKGSLRRLFAYLRPHRLLLGLVSLFAAASTVFSIVGPKILAKATDALASGLRGVLVGSGGIDFGYIGRVLLLCLTLYLASGVFQYIQSFIMAGVSTRVSYSLRAAIDTKINRLPFAYFQSHSTGDVLSRVTNDVDTLAQNLNQSITQTITSAATFVGVLAMMLSISVRLTLLSLVMVPVSALGISAIVKRSQKHFKNQQNLLGDVDGHIEEMYGGHAVVKAFCAEERSVAAFDESNDKLSEAAWRAQFLSGLMHPLMNFVGNVNYILVCVAGAAMATNGAMTIGGIQAFIQYVRSINQPVTQMANISTQIQQTLAAAERVFEFLDEEEEPVTAAKCRVLRDKGPAQENAVRIDGAVRFEHVRFGYDPGKTVIRDFSADVRAGQKVAIVGPTGAGKTTMVKLLMRFYDIDSGAILVDGHDIRDFDRHDLRTEFGMVLQDTWLFSGTILDNIRYGRLGATEEEAIAAAKAAQVDHFVRSLPDGYNMVLNEEASNISQGQKQLLTIARAILANARVLILDEATSSVDTRTEVLIQKAMDNLMRGRTSFVIAHRLSTIRDADLILCMDEGDIVEQGTHAELMAKNGFYARLYNSQFERADAS